MLLDILILVLGLVLILAGANFMTDGSVGIARRLGLSDFIIGLTIVSMMTSAPELVVSITSAVNASTEMAVGNIVGSNIFNILVIVGICAMIKPIKIEEGMLVNEIPLVLLSSVALLIMGAAPIIDGSAPVLTRVDGLILLLFFAVFMRYTFASAQKAKLSPAADMAETGAAIDGEVSEKKDETRQMPVWKALLLVFGGLAGLVFGGQWFVDGATGVARALGWSEALIGLTILAAGTSLPELATSVVSACKGFPGICVGNVIGSNIFNIFFVLGCTATVKPLEFGGINMLDLTVLTVASLLFWTFGWFFGNKTIKRTEGAVMFLFYVSYIVYLYTRIPA